MKYDDLATLETFLVRAESALLAEHARVKVSYPTKFTKPWNAEALATENAALLSQLSGTANVYAIFTAATDSDDFVLRYIGKTTRPLARQRLRNHLFKKSEKTGAKLAEIESHVLGGGAVKIAWLEVEPESLRGYIEEELIHSHTEADWNRENSRYTPAPRKSRSSSKPRKIGRQRSTE